MKTIKRIEVKKFLLTTHWNCDHCGKECTEQKHVFRFQQKFRVLCDECLQIFVNFFVA